MANTGPTLPDVARIWEISHKAATAAGRDRCGGDRPGSDRCGGDRPGSDRCGGDRCGTTGRRRGTGMVTLHDVAREADVAVSTVSRALSNPDRVSRSTRDHVLLVARKLGYQPPRSG